MNRERESEKPSCPVLRPTNCLMALGKLQNIFKHQNQHHNKTGFYFLCLENEIVLQRPQKLLLSKEGMGEVWRQGSVLHHRTRISTFTWISHGYYFFLRGYKRRNSVHMTLMGLEKSPYLEIWYKSKVIVFKSKLGFNSLARLMLLPQASGEASGPICSEAVLPREGWSVHHQVSLEMPRQWCLRTKS